MGCVNSKTTTSCLRGQRRRKEDDDEELFGNFDISNNGESAQSRSLRRSSLEEQNPGMEISGLTKRSIDNTLVGEGGSSACFEVSVATGHLHLRITEQQRKKILAAQAQLTKVPSDSVLYALGMEVSTTSQTNTTAGSSLDQPKKPTSIPRSIQHMSSERDIEAPLREDSSAPPADDRRVSLAFTSSSELPPFDRAAGLDFLEDKRDHALLEDTLYSKSVRSRSQDLDTLSSSIHTGDTLGNNADPSAILLENTDEILAKLEHSKRRKAAKEKIKAQKEIQRQASVEKDTEESNAGTNLLADELADVRESGMPKKKVPSITDFKLISESTHERDNGDKYMNAPMALLMASGKSLDMKKIQEEQSTPVSEENHQQSAASFEAESPEDTTTQEQTLPQQQRMELASKPPVSSMPSMPPPRHPGKDKKSTEKPIEPSSSRMPPPRTPRRDKKSIVYVANASPASEPLVMQTPPPVRKVTVSMPSPRIPAPNIAQPPPSPEVTKLDFDPNYVTPRQAKELMKWTLEDSPFISPVPLAKEIQIPAGDGPWYFEDLDHLPAFKRLCGKLRKRLNFDPWDDYSRFDDSEVKDFIQNYPWTCRVMYRFDNFAGRILPFSVLCAMKADVSTIEAAFEAYEEAVYECDPWIGTPLHYACSYHADKSVLKFLVKQDVAMLEQKNQFGRTPLHQACIFKTSARCVVPLLRLYSKAVLIHDEKDGYTPLHLACENGVSVATLKALLQVNPEKTGIAPTTSKEHTPLHLACQSSRGNHAVITALVEACPEAVEYLDYEGQLPLHLAVNSGASKETVELLIQTFPDCLEMKNDRGQTAHRIAKKHKMDGAILKILSP